MSRLASIIKATILPAVVVGSMVALPIWNHHDIKEKSHVLQDEAAAQAWLHTFRAGPAKDCLPSTIETKVDSLGFSQGIIVEYRCNTSRSYYRVLLGYLVPAAFAFIVLLLASGAARKGNR